MTPNSKSTTALSVCDLTGYLKVVLEEDESLQHRWIWGEVTSVNEHRSGLFFTLTDPERAAAIQCVVWNSFRQRLQARPSVGEQMVVLGSLMVYAKRGDYRLQVVQIQALGEGVQAWQLQQLRSRLAAEGLFDPLRKQPLPPNPQTIAVVSSPTAAAWGDIQRTLQQRQPGLHILFSPATVQGDRAPDSIAQAIARVSQDDRAEVMILGRGGGATEDLDCFNDERVVRAIANCPCPVITGIGHERDQTLADLVADVCAHTPTAAAERVVPDAQQRYQAHIQRQTQLVRFVARQVAESQTQVAMLRSRLQTLSIQARSLQTAQHRQQLLAAKLQILDPQAVLQRGYALLQTPDGQVLDAPDAIPIGQPIHVKLAQGNALITVAAVQPESVGLGQKGRQTSTMDE